MATEHFGYLMDAADYNFPLGSKRVTDLQALLRTAFLNACAPAEEEPTTEMISAAERRGEEVANTLIYEAASELAAFLSDGQPPEIVEQIHGWLALATGSPAGVPAKGGVIGAHA
jgi:hypothetical protein